MICPYCSQDTGGNHECNCPNNTVNTHSVVYGGEDTKPKNNANRTVKQLVNDLMMTGALINAMSPVRRPSKPYKFTPMRGVSERRAKRKAVKTSRKKNRAK